MIFNPFLAQQLGKEYLKERRREAERERQIRAALMAARAEKSPSSGLVGRLQRLVLVLTFIHRAEPESTETR